MRDDDRDDRVHVRAGAPGDGPRDTTPGESSGAGGSTVQTAHDKAATAPHPDDESKPETPTKLTKPSWRYALRKTLREFQDDQAMDLAAGLTYWGVLALAPAVIALLSILGVVGDGEQIVDDVMAEADEFLPEDAATTIDTLLKDLAGSQGAGIGLLIGLLLALWSASGYVNAFARAMNRIYEVDEGRPFWKLRPIMYVITLFLLLMIALVCVAMVLSGPVAATLGSAIGLSDQAVTIWNIAKWPVIVLIVVLIVAVLYYATPNVKQPKFRWISVGSVVAILVWAIATVGFAFYVGNFGSYDATYGALAGFVIFLLWIWLTNNALLFGAELDAEMERARQLQAGIEAEEAIQLPPRDTAASEKREKKVRQDLEQGEILRTTRGRRRMPRRKDKD